MKIEFLGVGEAFDPELGNSCYIVHSETKLLIDCGYAVPLRYFARNLDPDFLDASYITHFHADHTFGIPALLTRLYEEGRKKPLVFIGQSGTQEYVCHIMDVGYPTIRSKLSFELEFQESNDRLNFNELELAFAETYHSQRNFAVRIKSGNTVLAFSGDGDLTDASRKLYAECKILVHEAFRATESFPGHATAKDVIAFANSCPALEQLYLVHIQRDERRTNLDQFREFAASGSYKFHIPEPGQTEDV